MSVDPRLPHIVIGGAPRSGTTFLVELLKKHPDIFIAQPIRPEPKVCLKEMESVEAYRDAYGQYFKDAPETAIRVEKTTNYFENDEARERLAAVLPDARFVFILREPVARAYSNWAFSTKNGIETLSFEEAWRQDGKRPNPLPGNKTAKPFDYFSRGFYGTLAERWIKTLGRERIGFFLFEEAISAPESFTRRLQEFIGVVPLPWERLMTGKINATDTDVADIMPALREELRAYYRDEEAKLKSLTGLDLSAWS